MKRFTLLVFILIPIFSFSQSENEYKNDVGLNLTFMGNDGLGVSFRYRRQLGNRGIAKFELNTNNRYSRFGRIGYEFLSLQKGRFEIGTGLDLKYMVQDLSEFGQEKYKEFALEIPLELRFSISSEFNIYTGISFSKLLDSNSMNGNFRHESLSELRLGVGYKF